ncbi:MAG: hypothetical protein ACYDBH_22170 [Acidobacteriaceae bacterium]
MKFRIILFLTPLFLASCESKRVTKSAEQHPAPAAPQNPLPVNFKFSLFLSGSGDELLSDTGTKPFDSWTMDTSGEMNVRVSRRTQGTHFDNLNAMATLDPPDMDTLRLLIRNGHLFQLDSADLTQQCMNNEHYTLRLAVLSATFPPVSLSFDACATDYNLLLEPQRQYFKRFMDWWERMRIKYRPGTP